MGYGLEYYFEYDDLGGVSHRVEILLEDSNSNSASDAVAIEKAHLPDPVVLRARLDGPTLEESFCMPQELTFSFYAPRADWDTWDAFFEADYKDYKVKYNEDLELITIRHYEQETIDKVTEEKRILLEQKSRSTVQLVVKQKL